MFEDSGSRYESLGVSLKWGSLSVLTQILFELSQKTIRGGVKKKPA